MKIRKDDTVMVISGNYKGKSGKVLIVYPKKNRLIVEGVNMRKRHTKPSQKNQQGGIIEREAPIDASNVMIVDPKTNEPTRISKKIIIDENTKKQKRARVAKVSGEML